MDTAFRRHTDILPEKGPLCNEFPDEKGLPGISSRQQLFSGDVGNAPGPVFGDDVLLVRTVFFH
jgi:hypothetical protein